MKIVPPSVSNRWSFAGLKGWCLSGIALLTLTAAAPSWSFGPPLVHARTEVQVAILGERLYVIGGYPKVYDSRVDVYDAGTKVWTAAAPLPRGGNHLAVASGGGRIFVFGGCCTTDSEYATAYRYDGASNRWTSLRSLPAPCAAGAAAYLNGKVHIVGGSCKTGRTYHDVRRHLVYDPGSNTYANAAPIPWAREHFALLSIDGKLYAVGGRQETKTNETASMYAYNPKSDAWTILAPMPQKRSGFAATSIDGKIVVVGGDNGSEKHQLPAHAEVFIYDLASNTWSSAARLPYGVHGTDAAVLNGRVYLPGGSKIGGHDWPLKTMLTCGCSASYRYRARDGCRPSRRCHRSM